MEDYKLILYVLAIVAYFIYTAWRKAFNTPDDGRPDAPTAEQERPQRERPAPRPVPPVKRQQRPEAPATSFEDIMREMQSKMDRANEKARTPVEPPTPTLQPAMKAEPMERESRRALSLENPEQARLYNKQRKERLAAADAIYERKKQDMKVVPNVYGQLLHNPQSVRQAFILSEIFNRKQY